MDRSLWLRAVLTVINAMMVAIGLAGVIYLVQEVPTVENQALLALVSLVVGAVVREWGASNQWWFGSSKGSSDKTDLLKTDE